MNVILTIRLWIYAICGAVGAFFTWAFGAWAYAMIGLVCLMIVDYVTGLIIAGVLKKSYKSCNGGLSSKVGFQGLFKKVFMFVACFIAAQADILFNTNLFLAAIVSGFIINEIISIVENLGIMGIKIPAPIQAAIDILKKQAETAKQQAIEKIEDGIVDAITDLTEKITPEQEEQKRGEK